MNLYELAKAKNARVAHWYGARGGASQRVYLCYLCGCTIDTESARYPRTKHAEKAIDAHWARHSLELEHSEADQKDLEPVPKKYWGLFKDLNVPTTVVLGVPCADPLLVWCAVTLTPKLGERTIATLMQHGEGSEFYGAVYSCFFSDLKHEAARVEIKNYLGQVAS